MSGRLSPPRWTSHPALRVFGYVFLARDLILAVVAVGGLLAGGLAHQDTLSIVALAVGALALAGVLVASVVGQRRAQASVALPAPTAPPARRNPLRDALRERPSPQDAFRSAVADQVSSGRKLEAEMRHAHEQGAWDDEGWAYRRRVEVWTERTADVLQEGGRGDLARALADVEPPPRPPFEALLKGHDPTYARLAGLLDGRIALLEESPG